MENRVAGVECVEARNPLAGFSYTVEVVGSAMVSGSYVVIPVAVG